LFEGAVQCAFADGFQNFWWPVVKKIKKTLCLLASMKLITTHKFEKTF
jgi:hypothetical protein